MTTVGELCDRDVIVTQPDTTVSEAAKIMRAQHVGSIVIVENLNGGLRVPVGIVTDRDLVIEVMSVDLDAKAITVGDIARRELFTVDAEESAAKAIQLMRSKGVRRLPVVTAEGRLLGLVAFDDVLEAVTGELSELTRVIGREQAREAATRKRL